MTSNLLLYDWLSFTIRDFSLNDIKAVLGLTEVTWETKTGVRGYQFRQIFNNITLHYGGELHDEIWVELSGQGCRAYESYGANNWEQLLTFVRDYSHNLTRLDIAFDDHTGVLDIDEMFNDAMSFDYISKAKSFDFRYTNAGKTIYVGSPSSDVWICIYDKAKERQDTSGAHWVRVELRLKGDRALSFISLGGSLGEKYSGVMMNYLRFVEPNLYDDNKWRWSLKDYWADFLGVASAISIYTPTGVDYNLLRCEDFVYRQAGAAASTLINIYGVDLFLKKLEEFKPKELNDKYKKLLNEYKVV